MQRNQSPSSNARRVYILLLLLAVIFFTIKMVADLQESSTQFVPENVTSGIITASPSSDEALLASDPTSPPQSSSQSAAAGSIVAFPGAEGFGAQSVGGRGGKVIEVTNLNDNGPGSFRECVTAQGPRICIFRTGGTIMVQSKITVSNPYLTIAGQTAPGDGITLRATQNFPDEPLAISTHDVIIRYMRFRAGASAVPNSDRRSLTINNGAYNVIVDHCSFSWATDQPLLLIDGVHDTTIQWSIISEGLSNSTHYEDGFVEHSTGLSVSGKNFNTTLETGNISIHHNLLAHNGGRNPQNAGYGLEDVVNNVIYNWRGQGFTTQDLQANVPSNIINNFFKAGPDTTGYEVRAHHVNELMTGPRIFVQGNIGPHRMSEQQSENNIVEPEDRIFVVPSPFPAPAVTTTSAQQAYQDVLGDAGVRIPTLDAVDKRILEDVQRGEGKIIDCVSAAELTRPINCATRVYPSPADYTKYGITDPLDAKGWPVLAAGTAPADSDHDGMPDSWEKTHGLNPQRDESAQDRNGDGYTNIEEYINDLDSTFADVRKSYWAWEWIERLYRAGITAGCGSIYYCPERTVTRDQMAVFLERGMKGSSYTPPPATGAVFTDVPANHWAAAWIETLAVDGITSGCGGGNYCPDSIVTRAQMAVFLLRARHGANFQPPPAMGIFSDVPLNYWAAPWIEQLATEGITSGCGTGVYCPDNPVTRAQMAVFLVRAFDVPDLDVDEGSVPKTLALSVENVHLPSRSEKPIS